MINWHLDLFRNLSEVSLTMRMPVGDASRSDVEQYADRLEEWRSLARYPELVANVYIVRRTATDRVDVVPLAPGSPPLDRAHAGRAPSNDLVQRARCDVREADPRSERAGPERVS